MDEEFEEACDCLYISKDKRGGLSDKAKTLIKLVGSYCPYGTSHKTLLENGIEEETIKEVLDKKVVAFKDGFYY